MDRGLRAQDVLKKDMPASIPYRVGLGFDFHPFVEGRPLILGGVEIPHARGLQGHSDADAVLHALADALLGAAGLKDVGSYFPDSDERFREISSLLLLEKVQRLIRGKGFQVANVDMVVIAEEPRIAPHVEAMRSAIGRVLHLDSSLIGIKATTMEQHGVIGRREGIAAQAVVLLRRVEQDLERT